MPGSKWTPGEVVTALYFSFYGVQEDDTVKMIRHKCHKERTAKGVRQKLSYLRDGTHGDHLRQGETLNLDANKVGKYLRSIMGNHKTFNRIIFWGQEEIELCAVSFRMDLVLRIKLIFDRQSSKDTVDSVSLGKIALGQMNDVQFAYLNLPDAHLPDDLPDDLFDDLPDNLPDNLLDDFPDGDLPASEQ